MPPLPHLRVRSDSTKQGRLIANVFVMEPDFPPIRFDFDLAEQAAVGLRLAASLDAYNRVQLICRRRPRLRARVAVSNNSSQSAGRTS